MTRRRVGALAVDEEVPAGKGAGGDGRDVQRSLAQRDETRLWPRREPSGRERSVEEAARRRAGRCYVEQQQKERSGRRSTANNKNRTGERCLTSNRTVSVLKDRRYALRLTDRAQRPPALATAD